MRQLLLFRVVLWAYCSEVVQDQPVPGQGYRKDVANQIGVRNKILICLGFLISFEADGLGESE